jgi:hypothetical protein
LLLFEHPEGARTQGSCCGLIMLSLCYSCSTATWGCSPHVRNCKISHQRGNGAL